MNIKLLPLRTFQFLIKPLQGKGLGEYRIVQYLYENIYSVFTRPYSLIKYKPPGGQPFLIDISMRMGGIARNIMIDHKYEPFTSQHFLSKLHTLHARQSVIDVGANIGFYTLFASKNLHNGGMIYAFEPEPRNLRDLTHNCRVNKIKNVIIRPVAISDYRGTATLHISDIEWGEHSLINLPNRTPTRIHTVKTETLDEINEKVGLIKIDVEGSEVNVIQGAKRLIKENRPVIIVECWYPGLEAAGTSVEELLGLLTELGYKSQILDEYQRELRPATPDAIKKYNDMRNFACNLLCEYEFKTN